MAAYPKKRRLTSYRRYLSLLGCTSVCDLEDRIVGQVLDAIRETCRDVVPVRLSRIAGRFQIDPIPKFDTTVPHGRLTYDSALRKFIITLGAREWCNESSVTASELFGDSYPTIDPVVTRRLRFTYAHEMAHRFLFVERDASWVRAMAESCTARPGSARARELRRLGFNEERLCDRVAGRILVPEDLLSAILTPQFRAVSEGQPFDFGRMVKALSDHFAVSGECMLVQVQRALDRGKVTAPEGFCAFLIRESETMGSGLRASRKLRVRSAIVPKRIADTDIVQVFPGLGLDNLGEAFAESAMTAYTSPSWPSNRRLEAPSQSSHETTFGSSEILRGYV